MNNDFSIDASTITTSTESVSQQSILIEDGTKSVLGYNNEVGTVEEKDIKK